MILFLFNAIQFGSVPIPNQSDSFRFYEYEDSTSTTPLFSENSFYNNLFESMRISRVNLEEVDLSDFEYTNANLTTLNTIKHDNLNFGNITSINQASPGKNTRKCMISEDNDYFNSQVDPMYLKTKEGSQNIGFSEQNCNNIHDSKDTSESYFDFNDLITHSELTSSQDFDMICDGPGEYNKYSQSNTPFNLPYSLLPTKINSKCNLENGLTESQMNFGENQVSFCKIPELIELLNVGFKDNEFVKKQDCPANNQSDLNNYSSEGKSLFRSIFNFLKSVINSLDLKNTPEINLIDYNEIDSPAMKRMSEFAAYCELIELSEVNYKFVRNPNNDLIPFSNIREIENFINSMKFVNFSSQTTNAEILSVINCYIEIFSQIRIEKKIEIFKCFLLKKMFDLEENFPTYMIHFPFLYNITQDDSENTIRNLIYLSLFMETYYKDTKCIELTQENILNYFHFYIKTFDGRARIQNLSNDSPMLKYFLDLKEKIQKNGDDILIKKFLMSFVGTMIPEILKKCYSFYFSGSLKDFRSKFEDGKEKHFLCGKAFLANVSIFKKVKSNLENKIF